MKKNDSEEDETNVKGDSDIFNSQKDHENEAFL